MDRRTRVRFSLRYKIMAILFGAMLLIALLSDTLFYSTTRTQLLNNAVKQTELLAHQIDLEIASSQTGEAYIDNLLGNELRIASIAIEEQLPRHVAEVTNRQLQRIAAQLGVSGITLFQPTAGDIVGVRSTDPREIGLSTKGMGKWYIAFRDLLAGHPQASSYGTAAKDYWSGPFSNATSDPSKVDKWGYYYDGTTDYIIDPFYVSTSIPGYEQEVGVNTAIRHIQAADSDVLAIAVLNRTFGQTPIRYSYHGTSWVDVANEPVMYGDYKYRNMAVDVKSKNTALRSNRTVSVIDSASGHSVLKTFIPESVRGTRYVVEVVTDYRVISSTLTLLIHNLVVVSAILLFATALLSYLGSDLIAKPLRRITKAVDEIADRNFEAQVQVHRSDEIGVLADHVNEMSRKLVGYLRELSLRERGKGMDYLVMATHALVHELGTPLAAIRQMSELLPRVQPGLNSKAIEIVERMHAASDYANRVSREFTSFLKHGRLSVKRADILAIVSDAAGMCRPMMEAKGINLTLDNRTAMGRVELEVDADKLFAAIVNLLKNAMDAIPETAPVRQVRLETGVQGEQLLLDVVDTGVGIPRERWDSIFMPYSSTKKNGLGLGLTFSGLVAIAHGGTIEVVDSGPGGTRMRMRLPLIDGVVQDEA
ncbi:signal transduction histidine kinase [Alicyclobacillus sacchari]|uniref:histidine kinase n=2 Tax=Alicyclobacillus sacchari TaxID=392010 RepID=A0A4R8LMZ4_9BACL|nr:HAMP domain-containing sensor histidine kinase [Alicyclobacillus sacchari]TDY46269.1 signal transduction histidine kinase [Alicyclobacillus sacchari]